MRCVRKNPIPANYVFYGYKLKFVDTFLDLGVLLDYKVKFYYAHNYDSK